MNEATSRLQDAAGEGLSRSVGVSGESSHPWDAAAMGGVRAPNPSGMELETG